MVIKLMELIWREEVIPADLKKSLIVPIYEQKGDPLECGHFQGH